MMIRFGLCQCLSGHLDKSNFSERKRKVCCRFRRFRTSGATGITSLYKMLKKFWREVHWNRFGSEDERLKMREESVWRVV